jgi:serine/threonine protein kinase
MIGKVLDERYKIIALAGQGRTGIVYKAEHLLMKRLVAIKMLHAQAQGEPVNVERFKREAKTLSALKHPLLTEIYDFGVTPAGDPYLVMEYIEGEPLSKLIAREGQLKPERVISHAVQICSALSHAHEKGVVHRDIKPGNILISSATESNGPDLVKLLDFGFAKLIESAAENEKLTTTSSATIGDPRYMSPEQLRCVEIDGRSDLYSLACVMFESLTGKPPFNSAHDLDIAAQQMLQPAQWPEQSRPVPIALREIVGKAMEKDPQKRYASGSEMRDALARLALDAPPPRAASSRTDGPKLLSRVSSPLRSPLLWAGFIGCATILAFLAAFHYWQQTDAEMKLQNKRDAYTHLSAKLPAGDSRVLEAGRELEHELEANGSFAELRDHLLKLEKSLLPVFFKPPDKGSHEAWQKTAERLLEVQEKLYGRESAQVGDTAGRIGELMLRYQCYKEAIRFYLEAIPAKEEHKRSGDKGDEQGLAWTYWGLGCSYRLSNNSYSNYYDKAIANQEKGLAMLQSVLGGGNKDTASCTITLGQTYLDAKQYSKAVQTLKRGFELESAIPGTPPVRLAFIRYLIGFTLTMSNDFQKAIPYLLQAQKGFVQEKKWYEAGETTRHLGTCFTAIKQYDKAKQAYTSSLSYYQKAGAAPTEVAVSLSRDGLRAALEQQGKGKKASP